METINRIGLLLRRKFFYSYKQIMIMSIIMFFLASFGIITQGVINFGFIVFCLLLTCVVSCGDMAFKEHTEKGTSSLQIILPASVNEKYAMEIIFNFILLPIWYYIVTVFSLTFVQAIVLLVGAIGGKDFEMLVISSHADARTITNFAFGDIFTNLRFTSLADFLMDVVVLSISFLGAIMFRKHRFVKIWSITIGIMIAMAIIVSYIFVEYQMEVIQAFRNIGVDNGETLQEMSFVFRPWFINLTSGVLAIGLLVWSYIKLKSKKV